MNPSVGSNMLVLTGAIFKNKQEPKAACQKENVDSFWVPMKFVTNNAKHVTKPYQACLWNTKQLKKLTSEMWSILQVTHENLQTHPIFVYSLDIWPWNCHIQFCGLRIRSYQMYKNLSNMAKVLSTETQYLENTLGATSSVWIEDYRQTQAHSVEKWHIIHWQLQWFNWLKHIIYPPAFLSLLSLHDLLL